MIKQWSALAALVVMMGCSEERTAGSRQHQDFEELKQQLRQYRAEVQRSNERIVAMLQAHGLQSDNPSGTTLPRVDPHAGHGGQGGAAVSPSMSGSEVSKALHASHATMDQQMMSVPMTGDPDRDFLALMIPHHQGAIDMARIVIASGRKPEVRKFAEDIIAHQQAEIDLMNRWLQAPQ
jgi:hypothetical protein